VVEELGAQRIADRRVKGHYRGLKGRRGDLKTMNGRLKEKMCSLNNERYDNTKTI